MTQLILPAGQKKRWNSSRFSVIRLLLIETAWLIHSLFQFSPPAVAMMDDKIDLFIRIALLRQLMSALLIFHHLCSPSLFFNPFTPWARVLTCRSFGSILYLQTQKRHNWGKWGRSSEVQYPQHLNQNQSTNQRCNPHAALCIRNTPHHKSKGQAATI